MPRGLFTLKQQLQGVIQKAWNTTVNPLKPPAVDYLVVAGGGGGKNTYVPGGGGGAGGLLQGSVPVTAGTSYTVTVGAGGAATAGANSVFGPISSTGGGESGNNGAQGSGGSGGGASITFAKGQGVFGQGNAGGNNVAYNYPGGGGGAGTVGLDGTSSVCGNGGAGVASAISGTVTVYAGGGGGGANASSGQGSGGVGGGGTGGNLSTNATSGIANTGGGGGGSGNGTASSGGSGIVIVSYPDIYAAAASTTGSPTVSTSGSGSIYINGSSTLVSVATQIIPASGDFTIEFFVYISLSGTQCVVAQGTSGDAGRTQVSIDGIGRLYIQIGSQDLTTSTAVASNTWTYIAVTRSSNTITAYSNGSSVGSGTFTNSTQNTNLTVGNNWASQPFTGYVSNLRISSVVRTVSTTPTTPFVPSTSNTNLLLSAVSGAPFADSSGNNRTFTATSTTAPAWNQASPFATGLGYKNRVYTYTGSGTITF